MAARLQSVPLQSPPKPAHILEDGLRLDGRGFEEFRPVCEWCHWGPYAPTLMACPNAGEAHAVRPLLRPPPPCAPGSPILSCCAAAAAVVNTKVVTQAAGSAYAEFGGTKVMVAV